HSSTYDHTHWRIRDPVRSPIDKPVRAGLVVGSVTTSEYLVLYVFCFFCSDYHATRVGSETTCGAVAALTTSSNDHHTLQLVRFMQSFQFLCERIVAVGVVD
ncbi:hypothetical protein LZ30DRAFT_815916, partial [Colletotrichum cereale]